jgi:hypothetical protein
VPSLSGPFGRSNRLPISRPEAVAEPFVLPGLFEFASFACIANGCPLSRLICVSKYRDELCRLVGPPRAPAKGNDLPHAKSVRYCESQFNFNCQESPPSKNNAVP